MMSKVDVEPTSQNPSLEMAATALAGLVSMVDARINGVLLALGKNPSQTAKLQPTEGALSPLKIVAVKASEKYRECEVIDYSPAGTTNGDQVMWFPLGSVPMLSGLLEESADLANIKPFDPRRMKISDARLLAIGAQKGDTMVMYVQALKAGQIVAKTSKAGMLVKKGVLDVPKEELILLTQDVTAVVSGEFVFFSDRAGFQRLCGLLEELQAQASETFDHITANLKIQGIDAMRIAIGSHPSMLGKMASIQGKIEQFPEYRDAMTMPKLLSFIRSHPDRLVELDGDGADAELVFRNDPQNRFQILKLLDDDYLTSELTTLDYEANSKGQPIGLTADS